MYPLDISTTSLIAGGQSIPFFEDYEDFKTHFKKCVQAAAEGSLSAMDDEQRQACWNAIKVAEMALNATGHNYHPSYSF